MKNLFKTLIPLAAVVTLANPASARILGDPSERTRVLLDEQKFLCSQDETLVINGDVEFTRKNEDLRKAPLNVDLICKQIEFRNGGRILTQSNLQIIADSVTGFMNVESIRGIKGNQGEFASAVLELANNGSAGSRGANGRAGSLTDSPDDGGRGQHGYNGMDGRDGNNGAPGEAGVHASDIVLKINRIEGTVGFRIRAVGGEGGTGGKGGRGQQGGNGGVGGEGGRGGHQKYAIWNRSGDGGDGGDGGHGGNGGNGGAGGDGGRGGNGGKIALYVAEVFNTLELTGDEFDNRGGLGGQPGMGGEGGIGGKGGDGGKGGSSGAALVTTRCDIPPCEGDNGRHGKRGLDGKPGLAGPQGRLGQDGLAGVKILDPKFKFVKTVPDDYFDKLPELGTEKNLKIFRMKLP